MGDEGARGHLDTRGEAEENRTSCHNLQETLEVFDQWPESASGDVVFVRRYYSVYGTSSAKFVILLIV